ncbi:hypothetical protein [Methylophilus sp. QUAN]|uniref:hypothetical protein n=1 Tax=Methylophilus sp. QUAN TaxID=2781020 RepID=UPI00188E3BFB|nr:hypothetical protein [Methylophilus sp. QUAN]MBF4992259.1 hypothetical protein [Methylophilus sp. QUAN]
MTNATLEACHFTPLLVIQLMPEIFYRTGIFEIKNVRLLFIDFKRGNIKIMTACQADSVNVRVFFMQRISKKLMVTLRAAIRAYKRPITLYRLGRGLRQASGQHSDYDRH